LKSIRRREISPAALICDEAPEASQPLRMWGCRMSSVQQREQGPRLLVLQAVDEIVRRVGQTAG
jgi:hypothetical protein